MEIPRRLRSPLVLFVLAVVLSGGVLAWSLAGQPPLQKTREASRPTARLHVMTQQPSIVFKTAESSGEQSLQDYRRYQKTQILILKTRSVAEAAILRPDVRKLSLVQRQKDPVAWLVEHLQAQFPEDSEILEISLDGGDPQEEAAIVNAVADAYLERVVGHERGERAKRLEQLKELRKTYASLMGERRKSVRDLRMRSAGNVISSQTAIEALGKMRLQLLQLQLEGTEAQTMLDRRKAQGDRESESARKEIARLEDRLAVTRAQSEILSRESERTLASISKSDELDLSQLQDELKSLQEASEKINREVEALNIELNAPERIRLIEKAQATRGDDGQ